MSEIKNVVFDLGNVILRYDPEAMLLRYINDPDDIALCIKTVFASDEWRACDRGDGYREELLVPCMEKLPQRLRTVCEDICYRRDFELEFMPLTDGITELIRELKASGYRIYLLSNVGKSFHWFCDRLSVLSYFDGLFASSDFHMLKPDTEIFEAFFKQFGLDPSESVFIDDTVANCNGSENAGMKALCFNCGKNTVDTLRELLCSCGVKLK